MTMVAKTEFRPEWKAYVFWWLGLPLISLIIGMVAVCIVASKHHGPDGGQAAQHERK
jgi:hypothetical protein